MIEPYEVYEEWRKKCATMPLCDKNCNECPIVSHPNSRMLTAILNEIVKEFTAGFGIIQEHCPNLTGCYDCKCDDFTHLEGCPFDKEDKT